MGRRPGRRLAAGLPRAPRHRRAVGDPRAGRRRHHRRAGRRGPDPPGRAHRAAQPSGELHRRARHSAGDWPGATPTTERARRAPPAARRARRRVPRGRGRRRRRRAGRVRPGRERDPARARREPPFALARARSTARSINRVVRLSGADRRPRHLAPPRRTRSRRTADAPAAGGRAGRSTRCRRQRRLWGWTLAVAGLPAADAAARPLARHVLGLPSVLLLYLAARRGRGRDRRRAARPLVAAIAGFLLANWFFTPPLHASRIAEAENLLALVVFLVVAGDRQPSRRRSASRRAADCGAAPGRGRGAGRASPASCVGAGRPAARAAQRSCGDVRARAAAAAPSRAPTTAWDGRGGSRGAAPPTTPDDGDARRASVGADAVLVLARRARCRPTTSGCCSAFAAQLAARARSARASAPRPARADALAEANELRTALLAGGLARPAHAAGVDQGVGHAACRQHDVDWTAGDDGEFLATIDEETDRLTALVGNLLDMSRLQAGVVSLTLRPIGVDEVVPAAARQPRTDAPRRRDRRARDLPRVAGRRRLLERALANLIANAVRCRPPGVPVRVEAGAVARPVDLRVIDHGPRHPGRPARAGLPAVPAPRRPRPGTGVGLGLAVATGFVEAMGGELDVDDTPGGGATMVMSLRRAATSVERR